MLSFDQADERLENFFRRPTFKLKKQKIIDEITAAFDGVERGEGVSWHEAWVIDSYGDEEERAEARAKDREARWQDVPDSYMLRGNLVLNFLDPVGFRFYLPAYITWHLRVLDSDDPDERSDSSNYLIDALTLNLYGLQRDTDSNYSLFSVTESKAIAHFLAFNARVEKEIIIWQHNYSRHSEVYEQRSYIVPENKSQNALDQYWGRFF